MFSKIVIAAAAVAGSVAALPSEADAHGSRYRGQRHYQPYGYYAPPPVYYAPRRVYYAPRPVYYDRGYYGRGYDRYYDRRSYGRYDDRRYYRQRCGSGTTGAIIGGAGGALLGREIGRGSRYGRYGYRRGGSGTAGAIVGGVAGALIGREIGRSC